MQLVSGIQGLKDALTWRRSGSTVGLVITKGNLHQGHAALIGASLANHDLTVVASYAGPNLFYDQQSYQTYPQSTAGDRDFLEQLGVDLLFTPSEGELYPRGFSDLVKVQLPRLGPVGHHTQEYAYSTELVTLALKLCNVVQPQHLIYGEKHYQQLFYTELLLRDLNLPTSLHRVPVVRESDGLAVSTKNQSLSAAERQQAPVLKQTLADMANAIAAGARNFAKIEQTARVALRGAGFKTDYLWVCDAETLQSPDADTRHYRILGAARLGSVRLIDNLPLNL